MMSLRWWRRSATKPKPVPPVPEDWQRGFEAGWAQGYGAAWESLPGFVRASHAKAFDEGAKAAVERIQAHEGRTHGD